jgi:hypothetical protein
MRQGGGACRSSQTQHSIVDHRLPGPSAVGIAAVGHRDREEQHDAWDRQRYEGWISHRVVDAGARRS